MAVTEAPLAEEACLGRGMSEVQLVLFPEAADTLRPLTEKKPQAIQALIWLGKAQTSLAHSAEEPAPSAFDHALASLRLAVAQGRKGTDKHLLGQALIQLGETLVLAGRFKEAAAAFGQTRQETLLPGYAEELCWRQATALTRGGRYAESDRLCEQFEKTYHHSSMTAEILFCRAENATFLGQTEEAIRRDLSLVERYPEFESINQVRHALALNYYRTGALDKARAVWEAIPTAERRESLVLVPYCLADCLLRQAPEHADDALAAGRLQEQLTQAIEQLTDFVQMEPDSPLAPEALLRLGFIHHRLANLLANPEEQNQQREAARTSFESVLLDYPLNPLQPHAALERAKALARSGAVGDAITRMRRFTTEPLRSHPAAPLALLQVATWLRAQGKPADAVAVFEQCRRQNEKALKADPVRTSWLPRLQFHHAIALAEAGRHREAQTILEHLLRDHPNGPESPEVLVHLVQCRWEEAWQQINQANETLAQPDLKPQTVTKLRKVEEEGQHLLREALRFCAAEAAQCKQRKSPVDLRSTSLSGHLDAPHLWRKGEERSQRSPERKRPGPGAVRGSPMAAVRDQSARSLS